MLMCGASKQYSRQPSKRETVKAITLSKQISDSGFQGAEGLSSRRCPSGSALQSPALQSPAPLGIPEQTEPES